MREWQPIETAPKDSEDGLCPTVLLLEHAKDGNFYYTGYWNRHQRQWLDNATSSIGLVPTHWMPLPPPPSSDGE